LVVHDLHPDYGSCRIGRQLAEGPFAGARLLGVQHHHAHALSCLAENGRTDPALALALDGAGWGPDGTTWGGELLLVDGLRFRRLAHLSPMRLPGGDAAAREPWRTAVAALCDLGAGGMARELAPRWPSLREPDLRAVLSLCRGGARLPLSTGLGRLFDAAAAILGLRDRNTWE
ncbi:MAG: carbamoyltransferase HypF, partial [Calditrichia bacterium]|nr:carbamoyltransferase HypF [Calditrichia bacterium]